MDGNNYLTSQCGRSNYVASIILTMNSYNKFAMLNVNIINHY